jgi:excisionase family DNA binding protein
LRGQDLNLRPSGYEQPQGTSQPVTATDKPSQSLQDGQEDPVHSLQASPALPKDFGPPVVRTSMVDLSRIDALLTVKQVAAKLGVSAATVYGLCERRELRHVRVANAIRISPEALDAFLRAVAAARPRRVRR